MNERSRPFWGTTPSARQNDASETYSQPRFVQANTCSRFNTWSIELLTS
jgi:hypothetical protein